jgi:hypothetical protein
MVAIGEFSETTRYALRINPPLHIAVQGNMDD